MSALSTAHAAPLCAYAPSSSALSGRTASESAAAQARDVVSAAIDGQIGYLKLSTGRAVTLKAQTAGVLRLAQGRVWVTFCDAAHDSKVRAGDYFVNQGEGLPLLPGQSVVVEALDTAALAPALFKWEAVASPRAALHRRLARWALN